MEKKIEDFLKAEGYSDIREIEGRGICGIYKFIFTVALVYGIDEYGYVGRYCFPNSDKAEKALSEWDGVGDPDGDWIKHKGRIEYNNPKLPAHA